MKTLVVGVFDNIDDARRVLRQLSESPLDMRDVSLLHRDPELQQAITDAIGIPRDRSPLMALIIGVVLGGALAIVGDDALGGFLGPVLAAAAGALAGGALGAALGVLTSPLRIPQAHATALAAAVEAGSAAVLVHVNGMPTANAIGDLFRSAGAREMDLPPDETFEADGGAPTDSAAALADENLGLGSVDDVAASDRSAEPLVDDIDPQELFRPPDDYRPA